MKRKTVSTKKPTAARRRALKTNATSTRRLKAHIADLMASCDRVLKVLRRTFKAALA